MIKIFKIILKKIDWTLRACDQMEKIMKKRWFFRIFSNVKRYN